MFYIHMCVCFKKQIGVFLSLIHRVWLLEKFISVMCDTRFTCTRSVDVSCAYNLAASLQNMTSHDGLRRFASVCYYRPGVCWSICLWRGWTLAYVTSLCDSCVLAKRFLRTSAFTLRLNGVMYVCARARTCIYHTLSLWKKKQNK